MPAVAPPGHVEPQVIVVMPDVPLGQPQLCVGAGFAEIADAPVALVIAVEIFALSYPFTTAYSAPARAALPTRIWFHIHNEKSTVPISIMHRTGAMSANSTALAPDPARVKRSVIRLQVPNIRHSAIFAIAMLATPVPAQLLLGFALFEIWTLSAIIWVQSELLKVELLSNWTV